MKASHIPILAALLASSVLQAQQPAAPPTDVKATDLGRTIRVIGTLNRPIGSIAYLRGRIIEGPAGTNRKGLNIQVQRINGIATLDFIQLPIAPYKDPYGEGEDPIPKPEVGKSYELMGYESGGFLGVPRPVLEIPGKMIPSPDHQFVPRFCIVSAQPIDPITFGPADFIGRPTVLTGIAKSHDGKAFLVGDGWEIEMLPKPWQPLMEGKAIEGRGIVRGAEGNYSFENGAASLARLQDQVGRGVLLRGTVKSNGKYWWFEYRGTSIHVDNMQAAPGWSSNLHDRPVLLRGKLEEAELPRLDQVTAKESETAKQFIVRDPTLKEIPPLLTTELSSLDKP